MLDRLTADRKIEETTIRHRLGGRSVCRLTIPLITADHIKTAAWVLRQAGEELEDLSREPTAQVSRAVRARILLALTQIKLKHGKPAYRGAR